jgi:hypothetical protein
LGVFGNGPASRKSTHPASQSLARSPIGAQNIRPAPPHLTGVRPILAGLAC